jgi:hypothetical protein
VLDINLYNLMELESEREVGELGGGGGYDSKEESWENMEKNALRSLGSDWFPGPYGPGSNQATRLSSARFGRYVAS